MTPANRATRIGKLHSLLKKAYKPTLVSENRPLIEHLLYACLLENSPYELADEALARLEQDFFDWNEVRVTTVTELSEVLGRLPDPTAAAIRLKKNLHGLFESTYSFDLEELKKQNLGKALQKFEKLPAITPFVLSYITQHGLGGHAIPLDSAALRYFWLSDIINENELKTGKVTGLERAIPKSKGLEFSSLLHQAAVALNIDPNDEAARSIVLTLNPSLDQKVADHVAAVKQRREAKAIAAAEAEAEAEAAAEAADAADKLGAGKNKSSKAKASKTGDKASPKSAAKSSVKVSAKDDSKATKTPSKKAATEQPKEIATPDPVDPTSAPKPAKSSKSKTTAKKAAANDDPVIDSTAVSSVEQPKKSDSSTSKKSSKKSTSESEDTQKKSSKAAAAANDATLMPSADADAESKASSKKVSKRKPR